jgi:hypothetical protein
VKPSGNRLYRRESDETRKGGAAFMGPIRKLVHGVLGIGKVKRFNLEAVGKPIVRSLQGTWCARHKSISGYPKPADLCLGRGKPWETGVDARSVANVQIARVTWV